MDYDFRVKKSERGKPLENFIYEKLGTWSHKQVKQLLDKKKVFVNGKIVFISNWNLKPNDRVVFAAGKADQAQASPEVSRYQFVNVIYEDEYMLAVSKPPHVDYDSFVNQVNGYLKRTSLKKNFYPYLGQMHRLDRETSGLLLFTKKKIANTLADQFRERTIRKYYVAVVCGQIEKEHGTIKERLEKGKFEGGRKAKVAKGKEGKESLTEFWVEERYDKATVVRVLLGTGRTHQIRIHMSQMGHPVLGDKLYGGLQWEGIIPAGSSKKTPPIKRQALHAHQVILSHPVTGKKLQLEAPLPKDMQDLVDFFRSSV